MCLGQRLSSRQSFRTRHDLWGVLGVWAGSVGSVRCVRYASARLFSKQVSVVCWPARDLRFTSAMVARETAVAVYVVPTPTVRVLLPLYHTNCELTPQVHVLLAGYRAAASINSGLSRTNKSLATVRTDNAACRNDLATTHRAITTFIAACVVRSTGHGQLPPSDADDTNIDQASRGARGASLQRPVAPVADADIPCR